MGITVMILYDEGRDMVHWNLGTLLTFDAMFTDFLFHFFLFSLFGALNDVRNNGVWNNLGLSKTSGQSNLAKAAWSPMGKSGLPSNTEFFQLP